MFNYDALPRLAEWSIAVADLSAGAFAWTVVGMDLSTGLRYCSAIATDQSVD